MKKILLLAVVTLFFYSCNTNDGPSADIPEVTNLVRTNDIVSIGHISANVYGSLVPAQLASISAYGICYGLSANPSVSGQTVQSTNANSETGNFSCLLTSLSSNTTYHVRAYATINGETKYGDDLTFNTLSQLYTNGNGVTDVNGTSYPSIIINGKQWMKTNLSVTKYKNGDVIPEVTDLTQWDNLTTGAWCYYANDTANGTIYGKLYNWYAVNDPRGLAPAGWHIATDTEWTSLTNFLGGGSIAGSKLKLQGEPWPTNSAVSTNQSGFSALPAGYGYLTYPPEGQTTYESFLDITNVTYWWTATATNTPTSWTWNVNLNNQLTRSNVHKKAALSVRCIKN